MEQSILNLLGIAVLEGLTAAFILMLLIKWQYDTYRSKWMPSIKCVFCAGFWICIVIHVIVVWVYDPDAVYYFMFVPASVVSRFIIATVCE